MMIRKVWVLVIASVLVSVSLLGGPAFATGGEDRKKIVLFLDGTPLSVQQTVVALSGSTVVHPLSFINALAIELPLVGADQALAFLLNYTVLGVHLVVEVDDDLMVSVLPIIPALPGEIPPTETYEWGLEHIGVDMAHQEMPTLTGAGVTVAIVDTGVGPHPDLPPIVEGFNALPGGVSYVDDHGHGTHIAGIIAARVNGLGIIGAAPQTSIAAVKVLDANGQGFLSDLIYGLQWVYNNHSQKQIGLVNMSLGFSADSPPLQRAIQHLYERGILMVASAGNSCSDAPGQDEGGGDEGEGVATPCDPSQTAVKYPARYPWVLAVAATDYNDQITAYSLAGPEVDIAAPGGSRASQRILSTYLGGGYGYGSGTSQAAAHVTGALALKLQQQPQLSLSQVQRLLQHTAMDLRYPAMQQGWGLIEVERLLAAPQ
jgi:subtilisin family serine protease